MRDGRVYQPGLAYANGITDDRNSFSEKTNPWPPAGVASLVVVFPEADAPHGIKKAGFR